jgi:glycosyltransferase involved in cell wall biosynthesis
MRILNVTPAYEPFFDKGGPAVKVRAIAEHTAKLGAQVTVLTTTYDSSRAVGTRHVRGVEVVYLPVLARYRALTFNPGVVQFCRRRLREFDLVHIYGLYDLLGPAVGHYCHSRRVPYVLEPLGMIRQIDRSFFLKKAWHTLFGRPLLQHAARLIATSQQEYREMIEDGFSENCLFLRYNGIESDDYVSLPPRDAFRANHGISLGEPMILFLGRIIPRKGVDLLIAAFAQACPDVGRLVIAGPEGEPGHLHSLNESARTHGVVDRTLFTGPLLGDDKRSALVDADVFVLPSEYENFANSVAESIACGTPVVVTDRCGISEFVEQRVGLVIPRTTEALTDALRRLLTDQTLRERFASGCPEVAARLSWDGLIGPMMDLYREVIAANK